MNQYEKIILNLERKNQYKKKNKKKLLEIALELVDFYQKNKDLRYINLALKINDVISKNYLLELKIQKIIKQLKSS